MVITIDTEADHSSDWRKSKPLSFKSVTEAIPRRLEPVFKRYGAVGTYLLTVELLEDKTSLDVIKLLNEPYELGTHLHSEFIAPEKQYFEYAGVKASKFSTDYDPETERAKIEAITRLFTEKIGYAPKVYRGGKFGFGNTTASALIGLGYIVDTSVTPRVSWTGIGGQDFRKSGDQPYFIDFDNDSKRILEVPVSIGYTGIIDRLRHRPVWLRPSFSDEAKMRSLVDGLVRRHKAEDFIVLNIMFHNMEFYPGASPYAQSEKDCSALLGRLEDIIKYCKGLGAVSCRLSEIRDLYKKKI